MKAVLTLSSSRGDMNLMPSQMSSAQYLQPHSQKHTLATCLFPVSCDLSSGNDIGFHTIELL